ncbi:hypothetical protein [Thermococcus stetteri]|uniref:hypothetical protein n=1 Tax=Thermococcus stetteri TaxID=49900 RepID=UPI001AE4795B|nr:hypothetical protein [Thermococcus stetteri]
MQMIILLILLQFRLLWKNNHRIKESGFDHYPNLNEMDARRAPKDLRRKAEPTGIREATSY